MPELFNVLTPPAAWQVFRRHIDPVVAIERIPVSEALDRVLATALTAGHDLPNFARSTVDGYAVAAQDTYGASPALPAYLTVVGEVAMGRRAGQALGPAECALIHTGGMLPAAADAVVMVEQTGVVSSDMAGGVFPAQIEVYRAVAVGQNVIQVGEDVHAGDEVLAAGRRLRPQDLGGLLALGITEIPVARRPRVAIVSQGDEVVTPEREPGPGQVRDINSYTLAALARRSGAEPLLLGIAPDRRDALLDLARRGFAAADALVISAGSSVSVRDLTAEVIAELGQPGVLVHGLSVRPGKPTVLAVCDNKPVFGLPGNPVSAMVVFGLVVAPALRLLSSEREPPRCRVPARLTRPIASVSGREDYIPVRLEQRGDTTWAVPVFGKSNLIYTLIQSDGIAMIGLDSNGMAQGEWVDVVPNL